MTESELIDRYVKLRGESAELEKRLDVIDRELVELERLLPDWFDLEEHIGRSESEVPRDGEKLDNA